MLDSACAVSGSRQYSRRVQMRASQNPAAVGLLPEIPSTPPRDLGALQQDASKVVRFARFRIGFDGRVDLPPRFVEPLQAPESHGVVGADLRIAGFEFDRPRKVKGSLCEIAARGKQVPQIAQRIG